MRACGVCVCVRMDVRTTFGSQFSPWYVDLELNLGHRTRAKVYLMGCLLRFRSYQPKYLHFFFLQGFIKYPWLAWNSQSQRDVPASARHILFIVDLVDKMVIGLKLPWHFCKGHVWIAMSTCGCTGGVHTSSQLYGFASHSKPSPS